jgi:hypothetical protein
MHHENSRNYFTLFALDRSDSSGLFSRKLQPKIRSDLIGSFNLTVYDFVILITPITPATPQNMQHVARKIAENEW